MTARPDQGAARRAWRTRHDSLLEREHAAALAVQDARRQWRDARRERQHFEHHHPEPEP